MSTKRIQNLEAKVRHSRARLANRWSSLELEVSGLANTAKEEVSNTVQQAKDSVSITHQVKQRPWTMVAGSLFIGLALSRLRLLKGVAVLSLATPLVKSALESGPVTDALKPLTSFLGNSPKSSHPSGENESIVSIIRNKAVNSFAELARELVKRNAPSSLVPILDKVIENSTLSLVSSKNRSTPMAEQSSTHGVEEELEIPSIH